ncbi:hypothetical protein [Pseudomonas sp. Irchel 3E13]|uniref:hypothetical protein n=1 Tax=Pseudomonas sp. Irchel 3E13 TaxID=2008975 RepID=UPI000BA34623|nr:hypothetical protein [Pseudomonas sp. Irchel 3E13]
MTFIQQHEKPSEHAPIIFFNECGQMPWSGRHQSAFTGLEVVELLRFCEDEGQRQGFNDANQARIGSREEAPFHPEFMNGFPKKLWETAYWSGVEEQRDSTPEAIECEIQNILSSPDTSHWLHDALASAVSRDCADAVNDAEQLGDVLRRRFNATLMASVDS